MNGSRGARASQLYRKLLQALHGKIIPRIQSNGAGSVVLADLPLPVPPEVTVTPHHGQRLTEPPRHTYRAYQHWPAKHLEAVRSPCLIHIIDGEADLRIGVTPEMLRRMEKRQDRQQYSGVDYLTLSLPAGTTLLIPPGVPHSDGSQCHWERPHPERAQSRILWLRTLPAGFFCHSCLTQHGAHFSDRMLFAQDAHINTTMRLLIEELQHRNLHFEAVTQAQLLSILYQISRALSACKAVAVGGVTLDAAAARGMHRTAFASNAAALQRACTHIEAHLHEPLNVSDIAAEAFVSPTHLNRLFKEEFGQSPMKYVGRRRLETAQALLVESELPVSEIGRLVGYDNPSYFAQYFMRLTGESATDYRRRHRLKRNANGKKANLTDKINKV